MTLLVHDPVYKGWVFNPNHPTQGRRFINGAHLIAALPGVTLRSPRVATRSELLAVHTPDYVSQVLDAHRCHEWSGPRPDLAALAATFVGGTLTATEALLQGEHSLAIHLPGGKHHAQADASSGFCVFADLAIAAAFATARGHRVAILDIDAHHGDGTELLCAGMPDVLTFSVHQLGIFPGTGSSDIVESAIYNEPLAAGDGDIHLLGAIDRFIEVATGFNASMVFIAAGADGHADDPLSGLQYSLDGFHAAGATLAKGLRQLPMLVTGAGGYLPDDITPAAWTEFVAGLRGR